MLPEDLYRVFKALWVAARQDDVLLHGQFRGFVHGDAMEAVEVEQALLPVLHGRVNGRERGGEVARHAITQGEQALIVGELDRESGDATTGLFVGHADGAVERWPRVSVGGIEEVVSFAREVAEAPAVEGGGVRFAVDLEPLAERGDERRVDRSCGGREVVAVTGAHLVQIHVHLRLPRTVSGDAVAALGLRLPRPIAVEVEEIVVDASAGPGFVVFGSEAVAAGFGAFVRAIELHIALASVGVLDWIEDDHRLLQPLLHARVLAGEQFIGDLHRSLSRVRFVPVDVVAHPDLDGSVAGDLLRLSVSGLARIGERQHCSTDLVEALHVLGRGDDEGVLLASLHRFAEALKLCAIRSGSDQRGQILLQLIVGSELLADAISEDLLRRRDGLVVCRGRVQRVVRLAVSGNEAGKDGEESYKDSAVHL